MKIILINLNKGSYIYNNQSKKIFKIISQFKIQYLQKKKIKI